MMLAPPPRCVCSPKPGSASGHQRYMSGASLTRIFVAVAVSCISSVALSFSTPQAQSLKGEVLDEKSQPISGALCTLTSARPGLLPQQGISLTIGNDGQFTFPGLLPATYTIYCSALGHEPIVKTGIEVTQGQEPPFLEISLPAEVVVRER